MDSGVDLQVLLFNRNMGEWSLRAEEAFEKHLYRLTEYVKGNVKYEPLWYTGARRASKH